MIYHPSNNTTTNGSASSTTASANQTPTTHLLNSVGQTKSSTCGICARPILTNQISNEVNSNNFSNASQYHRECLKCTKCDRYLTPSSTVDKDPNSNSISLLIENSNLFFCANCSTKNRKMLSAHTNSTQTPQINSLNDLKSKFESQLNSVKQSRPPHPSHTETSLCPNRLSLNQKFYNSTSPTRLTASTCTTTSTFHQSRLFFELDNNNKNFSSNFSNANNCLTNSHKRLTSNDCTNYPVNSINRNQFSTARSLSSTNSTLPASSSPISTYNNNNNNKNDNYYSNANINNNNNNKQTRLLISKLNLNSNSNSSLNLINSSKTPPTTTTTPTTNTLSINTNNLNSNNSNSNNSNANLNYPPNWVTLKNHSSKCNIILKKMRRGNKRSKSLPAKFNIDSLLDYLNSSMVLNKYELKKLSQQRNLMLFMNSNNQINNSATSSSSAASNNQNTNNNNCNNTNYLNRLSSNRNYLTFTRFNHHTYHHQHHTSLSSGYNSSDQHSNSSTTTTTNSNNNNYPSTTSTFNFYRLSLNHLPLNSLYLNSQCTCGAGSLNFLSTNSKQKTNGDLSSLSNSISSFKPLSSSPNLRNNDSEDEEDLDEDLDDDLSLEDDDDEDLIEDDEEEESENLDLNLPKIDIQKLDSTPQNLKKSLESIEKVQQLYPVFQRAPGTSHCQHTARIDLRRVRSYKDLTQTQFIFSQSDFVFKEKLGEGFFANVKKLVSVETRQEMVLKELKLNCVNLQEKQNDQEPSEPLNYAELSAAHKSFLKEAQVLRNLNHPNVIKLLGILFTKEKHLNLILEYISGGTLKDIIHNISIPLPWKLRVGYARDIAAAMQYLHSLNIIHRDLKSDNCLVRENGRTVVVADFGLSRIVNYSAGSYATNTISKRNNNNSSLFFARNEFLPQNLAPQSPESSSSATNSFIVAAKRKLKRRGDANHQRRQHRYAVVGNSFSMAPEMLKHQIYDERVDIFSFGIICCEIIGRVQADPDYLPRTSDFGLNVELFRKKYCEADCPKHFIKIAIACCELEPEKRPPFAKTHLWLETILSHLEANNPIPKNLLKNILDSNNTNKRLTVVDPVCATLQQNQKI